MNGDDGSPIDWVTVATFDEPTAAHVARLRLENEEIDCFVADENIGTMLWHYSIATGGIKLQVPREQVERAEQLLAAPPGEPSASADENLTHCPKCGSTDVRSSGWRGRRAAAIALLVMFGFTMYPLIGLAMLVCAIYFMSSIRRRTCDSCGAEWREPPVRGFEVVQHDRQDH